MKTFIFLVCLVISSNAFAEWSTQDTVLQTTYIVLHTADYLQTSTALRQHENYATSNGNTATFINKHYEETNLILGKNPSQSSINIYFASTLIIHSTISYLLPDKYRTIWQCITVGIEGSSVAHNYNAGVRLSF